MGGFRLETAKFAVYLIAPIVAVVVYSIPAVHEWSLSHHRYIVFPAPLPPIPRKARPQPSGSAEGSAAPAPPLQ